MTTITTEAGQASIQTTPSLSGSILQVLRQSLETLFRWQQIRAGRRALYTLDDWQLHDLGLSRGEIDRLTRFGRL